MSLDEWFNWVFDFIHNWWDPDLEDWKDYMLPGDRIRAELFQDLANEVVKIRESHMSKSLIDVSDVTKVVADILSSLTYFQSVQITTEMFSIFERLYILDSSQIALFSKYITSWSTSLALSLDGGKWRYVREVKSFVETSVFNSEDYVELKEIKIDWSKTTISAPAKDLFMYFKLIINIWDIADKFYLHKTIKNEMPSITSRVDQIKYYDILQKSPNIANKIIEYENILEDKLFFFDVGKILFTCLGGILGKKLGAVLGASLGASLGTAVLPGVGTISLWAVGTAAGALVGGLFGEKIAEVACDIIYNSWDFNSVKEKINRVKSIESYVAAEIINIYSEGADKLIQGKEKVFLEIKNVGKVKRKFIVTPDISRWKVSDSWSLLETPIEYLDFNNEKNVGELDPGSSSIIWFAISPDGEHNKEKLSFSVWYDENGWWPGGRKLLHQKSEEFYSSSTYYEINVMPDQTFYSRGDTAKINIKVKNHGAATNVQLGVSFRDTLSGQVYDADTITPSGMVSFQSGQERTFEATWHIPVYAKKGLYQIAVNCWYNPYVDGHFYPDNLEWINIFYVEEIPTVSVISPTQQNPARVGSYANPIPFEAYVSVMDSTGSSIFGLNNENFKVFISDSSSVENALDQATFNVFLDISTGTYRFIIFPPTKNNGGSYVLRVELIQLNNVINSATEENAVIYSSEEVSNVDVVLVIDRSGSMSWSDPPRISEAKSAAKQFVDLLKIGDRIGIVSFESAGDTKVDFTLTPITAPHVQEAAKQAIDSLYADGATSIGEGLRYGLNQLISYGDPVHPQAIILLSDGGHNSGEHPYNVLPNIKSAGIRVYTIGLGKPGESDVDHELLSNIAHETGGTAYVSPTTVELRAIYNSLAGIVRGQSTILYFEGNIDPGQTQTQYAIIDSTITTATFSSTVSGSELGFALYDPFGHIINETVAAMDENITYVVGDGYKAYIIEGVQEGVWTMQVYGKDVIPDEPYQLVISAETNLSLHICTNRDEYYLGEPIQILASVMNPSKVFQPHLVIATIIYPNLQKHEVQLFDDGAHNDGSSNDGLFSNYVIPPINGTYTIVVTAEGTTTFGDAFQRTVQKSVFVKSEVFTSPVTSLQSSYNATARPGSSIKILAEFQSSQVVKGVLSVTDLFGDQAKILASNIALSRQVLSLDDKNITTVEIEIHVPPSTPPDIYKGNLMLSYSSGTITVPLYLDVKPFKIEITPPSIEAEVEAGRILYETFYINISGYGSLDNLQALITGDITGMTTYKFADMVLPENGSTTLNISINVPPQRNETYYGTLQILATNLSPVPIGVVIIPIDTIPPTTLLTISLPKYLYNNVTFVSPYTSFNLSAEDNPEGFGVAATAYRISNSTHTFGWVEYSEPFSLKEQSDGVYQIHYNSTDNAKNVEPTHTTTVYLDRTPPTIQILSPSEGKTYLPFTIRVSWTSSDNASGVNHYEIKLNSGEYINIGNSTSYVLSNLPEGEHTIFIRAIDNVGNIKETSVKFTVIHFRIVILIIAVVLLLIIGSSIFMLIRRRRKQKTAEK
jgi:Mg-chelatase subunit ChlD